MGGAGSRGGPKAGAVFQAEYIAKIRQEGGKILKRQHSQAYQKYSFRLRVRPIMAEKAISGSLDLSG